MHYQNHLEAVFVLKGNGTIEDLGTGETHELSPGVMYALDKHDRHIVRPETDILTACVFNPPVTGQRSARRERRLPGRHRRAAQGALVNS